MSRLLWRPPASAACGRQGPGR